jgi:pyruvate,water dikinase
MLNHLRHIWKARIKRQRDAIAFPEIFEHFQGLLKEHQRAMELIADLGEKSGGEYIFDRQYLVDIGEELQTVLLRMVKELNLIASNRYVELYSTLDRIFLPLGAELRGRLSLPEAMPYVISLDDLPFDAPELTGGKANTLKEIMQRPQISVPAGFVITTRAYRRYIENNNLEDRIHALVESWISGEMDERHASRQIQYSILAGVVPPDVARDVMRFAERGQNSWAVRSSAYGEGGELSFAGLHESILHVPPKEILEAYKKVLSSLYSPQAMVYRRQMGMLSEEAAMAVLCQTMIHSQYSGIIHSLEIGHYGPDSLVIYASPKPGRMVVEGKAPLDRYVVDRNPSHRLKSVEMFPKETPLKLSSQEREKEALVPTDQPERTSLSGKTIQDLARWAIALERFFKRPQEIEWAMDLKGQCWVFQSRHLTTSKYEVSTQKGMCESCAQYRMLIKDRGVVAHAGVGAGPVFIVRADQDMDRFPEGAVLVAQYPAPWLARIVPKASAIIAEMGSAAGHLATIAREFRVPALFQVDQATEVLPLGMEITLDTHQRIIYEGRVQELLHYELLSSMVFEEAPEFRLLRRILKRVASLQLVNPQDSDFTPQGCKSVHDVIRFIHEKAIQEFMDLHRFLKRFKGIEVRTLTSEVPLGLKILDIGGGLDPDVRGKNVTADQIQSLPLKALWEGITCPGAWNTEPIQVDFKGMMSSLTKTFSQGTDFPFHADFNLAVIGGTYMNLHLRLGYHFNLIDARMEQDARHNHIYFRFVGGVTEITRRSRRAQLLAQILMKYHFKVDIKGDLVVGRVTHLPPENIQCLLKILGRLIGFTRQLDIQLRSDQDVPQFVEAFFDQSPLITEGQDLAEQGGEDERKQA